ncbi:MAG TPA: class I SAM-dependent methyltransferase [Gemmatimonadaceae bacterium]|nr:class I SAM-dependent methyltransferase [Gemmatimonadaceae bacterium]
MPIHDADRAWEWFGATDPYFAVLTDDRYSGPRLSTAALEEFFASGERYTVALFDLLDRSIAPGFAPARALDFGCGVGRVLIPLSRRCEEVVGVDVSQSMLQVALRNCQEQGIANAALLRGDDELTAVSGTFDFIHSFIVFQHIPVARGEALTRRLLELLRQDGVGALHYTYDVQWPGMTGISTWAKLHVPLARTVANLIKRRPIPTPVMQMNAYSLSRLMRILHDAGCEQVCMRGTLHTEEGGLTARGVMVTFRKGGAPRL